MNFSNGRLSLLVALILFAGLSGHLFAGTFTVTSTDDPEFIDTSNCLSPNLACSLREALAAADSTSEPDVVVFKVDGPIHLTRMVTVANPVIIDGGGETIVRVHQGYEITTLEDRNDDPSTPGLCGELVCPELPVLQPTFFSVRGPNRPMLELYGKGSVVRGLVLDGSITPKGSDLGVERIDFESNDSTDFFLFTIDSNVGGGFKKRWLIAGGVRCVVPGPGGAVDIIGNEFRNFSDKAILVEGTPAIPVFDPVISDNLISGGAGDQDFASADGISLFWSFGAVISKNVVSGFRNGLAAQFFSGASVTGNEFVENGIGAGLAFADDSYAWNVIDGNVMSGNAIYGLSTTAIAYSHITNNDMHDNGSDPENDGGVLLVNSSVNLIAMNEVNRNTGFGIVIDGHFINEEIPDFAVLNTVQHNDVKFNGGAGIVLLNKAHDNLIEFNDAFKNSVGIVAGFESPFPFGNTFDSNTIERNSKYDVLDSDPTCNDIWIANEFGSVGSIPGGCFE